VTAYNIQVCLLLVWLAIFVFYCFIYPAIKFIYKKIVRNNYSLYALEIKHTSLKTDKEKIIVTTNYEFTLERPIVINIDKLRGNDITISVAKVGK